MDKSNERLNMLQRNNQQLSAELALVREENQRLDKTLAELRSKQDEYTDTLTAVDRSWQQLNTDMQFIARRIRGFAPEATQPQVKTEQEALPHADIFLQRLISCEHPDAEAVRTRLEEMADDATDVEKSLAPRVASTLQAFVALVDLQGGGPAQLPISDGSPAEGQSVDDRLSGASTEAMYLRAEVDAQKAVSRTAEAQLRQLTDMLKKDEQLIQDLNNELADKREEVNAANRKLHALKSEGGGGLISQGSLPPPLTSRSSLSPAPKSGELEIGDEFRLTLKELRSEKDRADGLARQLRDLQSKLQDESFVQQTAAFQVVQRQLLTQTAELDKARRLAEGLQREAEGLRHSTQGLAQQADEARHQRRMVHLTEERMQELEHQIANARMAKEAAELALQQERQATGGQQTLAELRAMLDALETEARAARTKTAKRESLVAEAQAARKEARAAVAGLEAKEAELKHIRQRLEKVEAENAVLREKDQKSESVVRDLKVFVEVLHSFCEDPRDLAEVRASEASLKSQLSSLQKQLKGHELQAALDKAKAAEAEASAQVSALEQHRSSMEVATADLKRQCKDLQQQVDTLTSDTDACNVEMEMVGAAFEEMQGRNSRLLQQLAEREERANQLLTEKLQAQHAAARLIEQGAAGDSARRVAEQQAAALQERATTLEARLQEATVELGQARERATLAAQQAEKLAADVREREAQVLQRDSQLATAQGAAEQRKRQLDEEAERLHRDKAKRQRLEEECKVLQGRIEKAGIESDTALHEELEGMRLLTRCRVCRVRSKDTVITKCWHTFCRDCVQRIIETRNRKCPACGHGFGATDFKQIYL